jgi:hypothetical protein
MTAEPPRPIVVQNDGTVIVLNEPSFEPGMPVPVRTDSRLSMQTEDLSRIVVETHLHNQGYNLNHQGMVLRNFMQSMSNDNLALVQAVREDLVNCHPSAGYYLGTPFDPITGQMLDRNINIKLTPSGVRIPRDIPYVGEGPMILRAGPRELVSMRNSRALQLPMEGEIDAVANIVPGLQLSYNSGIRNMNLMDQIMELPPEIRQRTMLGLTNIDPAQPGQINNLLDVLSYAEILDPGRTLRIGGTGEFNLAKEAVMGQLSAEHQFDFARDSHLREFLGFANDKIPGFAMVVHMDAGRPLEFGIKGSPEGLLIHGATEYTNYKPFVDLVNDYPNVNFIHAHAGGLSRSGYPTPQHTAWMAESLQEAKHGNLYFDMSWDVVSEKVVTPQQLPFWAGPGGTGIMNRYPNKFVWGSDAVAPTSREAWLGNLQIQQKAGLLGNLVNPELYLRNNALGLLSRSADSIMNYRIANSLRLLNRPLPSPWMESVSAIRNSR